MAIIKCKMCGGDIEISADKTFGTCEYCGSTMTLPKVDDEQRLSLFNRGTHLRRNGEFDKAAAIYERLIGENDADAEAHWNLLLCRYGIEYVQDPASGERIPTCHRASFDSILNDVDYQAALQYSDGVARSLYEKEAQRIAALQKDILAISQKETPFDVFICYKESDENGKRTKDSALAQDIYYQLTDAGYKVFFARITLEDKLGQEYEPYIFAALHSAKVMVVVGTKPEYLNAVWVRNEWSRYLALMRTDRSRLLIPCYRDMDPYDMPEELSMLQSQDMSKIGFLQDLIRGINKITSKTAVPQSAPQAAPIQPQPVQVNPAEALLKRTAIFLTDGDFENAQVYANRTLDIDPENPRAYIYLLLAQAGRASTNESVLLEFEKPLEEYPDFRKAYQFSSGEYRDKLEKLSKQKKEQIIAAQREETRKAELLRSIVKRMSQATTAKEFLAMADELHTADPDKFFYYQQLCLRKAKKLATAENAIADAQTALNDTVEKLSDLNKSLAAAGLFAVAEKRRLRTEIETLQVQKAPLERTVQLWNARLSAWKAGQRTPAPGTINEADAHRLFIRKLLANRNTVAAGTFHTVGLKDDGTVVAVGRIEEGQCSVSGWKNIIAVAAGGYHTVGLKADGTVVAVGKNDYGQCNVSGWTNIVAVAAGSSDTVGLKADGTVVTAGQDIGSWHNNVVSGWTDIVAAAVDLGHMIGLKADGTVVAEGSDYDGQSNVSGWTDIVAVAAGADYMVGLKADGTVVAAGANSFGRRNVSDWKNMVSLACGYWDNTVGLKADGTVVAVGKNDDGQCNVSGWTDIVAVAAGSDYTVGLKADGTVVAAGANSFGKCDVSGWADIKLPNN